MFADEFQPSDMSEFTVLQSQYDCKRRLGLGSGSSDAGSASGSLGSNSHDGSASMVINHEERLRPSWGWYPPVFNACNGQLTVANWIQLKLPKVFLAFLKLSTCETTA